jgi:hypothetical protein
MQTNTATLPTRNLTVADNASSTITANYNTLNIGKAAVVTISGTIYGVVTIGEGAQVTFTQSAVNIQSLILTSGKLNVNYTNATFSGTAVKIKTSVVVGDRCRVNASNATFFVTDATADLEKFSISSSDTRFNSSIYMPKGKLQIKGTVGPVIMTGIFMAENIASNVAATWNGYNCAPSLFARNENTSQGNTEINLASSFDVTVAPNPSSYEFDLKIISNKNEPITIRIIDAVGSLKTIITDKLSGSNIKIGRDFRPGTYFAEVIKGNERKVIKLIKIN